MNFIWNNIFLVRTFDELLEDKSDMGTLRVIAIFVFAVSIIFIVLSDIFKNVKDKKSKFNFPNLRRRSENTEVENQTVSEGQEGDVNDVNNPGSNEEHV